MKNKLIVCSCIVLLVVVTFFPTTTTHFASGNGQVLTSNEEKIGNCKLSLEIKEVKSLLFCYKKSFSFVLDEYIFPESVSSTYDETDGGICFISQIYYDKDKNRLSSCSLAYQDDLSYFVLQFNEKLYTLETTP